MQTAKAFGQKIVLRGTGSLFTIPFTRHTATLLMLLNVHGKIVCNFC